MKILLLRLNNPFQESSASANRFRGLIEGLVSNGHEVCVGVTGGFVRREESRNSDENVIYLSRSNRYSPFWIRVNNYFLSGYNNLKISRSIRKVNLNAFDVVWLTNEVTVLKAFRKVEKSFKGKTLMELNEFNDIYKGSGATGNLLQRRKSAKRDRLFCNAIGKIDLLAIMTTTLIAYYKNMAKTDAKFLHLPMTVDLSRFEHVDAAVEYSKPYIAFTGTFNNAKDGVDVLIKAFAKNADKYPLCHLYLAGFWHYDVPEQEALVKQFGLESRVHNIGVLNREQIPSFICNASVLALSRPDSHQAQGGFPTKLGEYLATGNPVCVTKVGEIPDYLEDNVSAFMADPGDVDSFADALDRALSDSENAKRVGMNGRKVAEENFDARKQARRLSDFMLENLK